MADSIRTKELSETEQPLEIEIAYTEQEIAHKLNHYSLNQKSLFANLNVNSEALQKCVSLKENHNNVFLIDLKKALNDWQKNLNLSQFSQHINQLIFLWLNAIQNSFSIQNILNCLSCFESNSLFSKENTKKLHLFLFDMVAETTQQYQQHQLNYSLNFDTHTQLPNANQILSFIEKTINKASNNQLIALFSIQFQIARNSPIFSHIVTINLSQKIASILKKNISTDIILFHSGNLQFDLLIADLNNTSNLDLLAAKINRAFEDILLLDEHDSVLVTPFAGAAVIQKPAKNSLDLYANAKSALENAIAKHQQFVKYSASIEEELQLQNDLENKVLDAFSTDNLTLFFQPIVDLNHSTCAGAELLLRWCDDTGDNIYPSVTIEILNKVGKGKLFTRWLINSACRYASELIHEHDLPIYLTINLRAEDLYDIELRHLLLQTMALWKISPQDIVLEITENGFLEYNETSLSVIQSLSDAGFRLALDDFGTGFSSLSRLRSMPIDLIKIDQSFVRDIKHSADDFEIVKSIAMLANSLGKEVLAEGVEDKDCLDLIKQMKIHKCQGYYFAKPMPFEQFVAWAKQHQPT
ncbi:MAG: EAL domain-containing protein [Pseudomonadota bacterium]